MRSSLPLVLLLGACLAVLVATSCASAGSSGERVCSPILSWASPAYRCATAATGSDLVWVDRPVVEEVDEDLGVWVDIKDGAIELSDAVQFHSGSANLLPQSEKLLVEVAEALNDHPEILRVRVEGHADSRAGSRYNRSLSRKRARAVRTFLIEQGVSGRRLVARGYGDKEPIESNRSRQGRTKNRRVEFKILKRR